MRSEFWYCFETTRKTNATGEILRSAQDDGRTQDDPKRNPPECEPQGDKP